MASKFQLHLAVQQLKRGGIIAYPTEGVWGLGCDPYDVQAVIKLLTIKRRPLSKGLILLAANLQQIEPMLYAVNNSQRALLEATWPAAKTFVVPDPERLMPGWLTGAHQGIAVRVSRHPQVRALCEMFAGPIVSTSANVSNFPAARSALTVQRYFHRQLDYILPGSLGDRPSATPIVDISSNQVIRAAQG